VYCNLLDYDEVYLSGSDVDVYVIDTGILVEHLEFEGRARFAFNNVDQNNTDCNGHGTAVAALVGGKLFGVAKKVSLIAVKPLACSGSGTYANIIAAIDFVTKQYSESKRPSVVAMAVGGSANAAFDTAIRNSILAGVTYAVPGVQEAVKVASTTQTDARASFSAWGRCIDVFAPGVDIITAFIGGNNATRILSGSSWSTGLLAGAIAVHLGENPTETPPAVKAWVASVATPNVLQNVPADTPNLLLYSPYT